MDKNENQMTPPLQSLDKETKPQFKHKVLAIINFVMGMFYIFFPLVTIFFVLPKMKAVYESFAVKQPNFLTTYFLSLALVTFGIINIFVGLKLLAKSTVNREKYFKVGVILAVVTFFLVSISQAFTISSVISPMYNLVGTIDQNVPSVTPAPSPTLTPDPTAGWITYSGKYFSFKYPQEWKNETRPNLAPQNLETINLRISPLAVFTVAYSTYAYEERLKSFADRKSQNINVGGREAMRFDVSGGPVGPLPTDASIITIIVRGANNTSYTLNFNGAKTDISDSLINKLLSTFKFLEDPTANWKTYSNSNLGIEFKYPDDLKIATESVNSVSFNGLFQPGNQVVPSFTISNSNIIDVKNLKLCSGLTATPSYCVESREDIKKIKLAGVEAIQFPAFFGDNSGAQQVSYQIIQTVSEPIIEFKQPIAGGGPTDLDRILPTIKFLNK